MKSANNILFIYFSIDAAIDMFSKARPPGIYKQDYLDELLAKYGDGDLMKIPAPPRPDWCNSKANYRVIFQISATLYL